MDVTIVAVAIEFADEFARRQCHELGWLDAESVLSDLRGFTVRCTPHRRTMCWEGPAGVWFKKLRTRSPESAHAEWRWLGELSRGGLRTATPVCLAWLGRDSVLVTRAVSGMALDAWLSRHAGDRGALNAMAVQAGEVVRELHRRGLCHRDLYWNHLIVGAHGLVLLDLERVFRPLWRRNRWRRKDLAGLVSSMPAEAASVAFGLRLLRSYLGGTLPPRWKSLAKATLRKAQRIRAHRPRFG